MQSKPSEGSRRLGKATKPKIHSARRYRMPLPAHSLKLSNKEEFERESLTKEPSKEVAEILTSGRNFACKYLRTYPLEYLGIFQ